MQTTQVNPDVQEGWGKRNSDWQFSAGVQHELLPRVSVDVSYSRRWWGNFFATHNSALGPQDYDEVTLTAPRDPRLPGGGGYPVSFLVRNNNSVLGVSDPLLHDNQGLRRRDALLARRRLRAERAPEQRPAVPGRHQHGTRRQRHVRRADRPVRPADDAEHGDEAASGVVEGQPACNASEPWLTTFRGLASYTVPKIDVLVSAIVRSQANVQPGADVATNGGVARGQLPDERGAVPGGDRPAAAAGCRRRKPSTCCCRDSSMASG